MTKKPMGEFKTWDPVTEWVGFDLDRDPPSIQEEKEVSHEDSDITCSVNPWNNFTSETRSSRPFSLLQVQDGLFTGPLPLRWWPGVCRSPLRSGTSFIYEPLTSPLRLWTQSKPTEKLQYQQKSIEPLRK